MYQIRTDLALETQEKMQEDKVELKGVRFSEEHVSKNLTISTVVIETENGAKAMEKPKGTYITIEASNMDEEDEDYHREISEQLAKVLKQLISVKKEDVSVLIVGLGNRAVTPDALGPRVVDNLYITRHIINEYGKYAFGKEHVNRVSSIVPGVMAQTGMESMEIVNGIVKETKPEVVFAIDAIAAGKQGAISIHRFVQPHSSLTIGRNRNDFIELNKNDIKVENYDNSSRQIPGHNDSIDTKHSFRDAKLVFTEEQVKAETARCLGCGASVVDQNKCIGCGICTTKCEFDAIKLHRELPGCSKMVPSEDKLKYILPNGAKQAIKIKFSKKK